MTRRAVSARIMLLAAAFAVACSASSGDEPADDPNPPVWVDTESGVYHCKNSQHYEATAGGQLALESDARAKGYRPANDELCGDGTILASPDSAAAALARVPLPENPGPVVWVNTSSGVYHCPGSRYHQATKAGVLMSERAADSAGHRPAGGRGCS